MGFTCAGLSQVVANNWFLICPQVQGLIIGLTWTLCRSQGWGLAMSPGTPTRTLSWPGTLAGRPVRDLTAWVRSWDPYEATLGTATVNSVINADSDLAASATPLFPTGPSNLAVFEHFADRLAGKRVVLVGRYPGLETLSLDWHLTVAAGGGTRIFETGARHRVAALADSEPARLRTAIAHTAARREALNFSYEVLPVVAGRIYRVARQRNQPRTECLVAPLATD